MMSEKLNKFILPIEPYETGDYLRFRQTIRRRLVLWATHLGDDVVAGAGTPVKAIGDGEAVWSRMRPGSRARRNWGGIVIIRHRCRDKTFYSIYGHLTGLRVKEGDKVLAGQAIGAVAPGNTPENGWWQQPHLHFSIYTGPWRGRILPGYARPDDWLRPNSPRRTRLKWWHDPRKFIAECNKALAS